MPEVGAALVPRLERALAPARIASDSLMSVDAAAGAAWTSIAARIRDRRDHRSGPRRAGGSGTTTHSAPPPRTEEPNIKELRLVCTELQRKVG